MENITELNNVIYAGAKVIINKLSIPIRNPKKNGKTNARSEMRLEK